MDREDSDPQDRTACAPGDLTVTHVFGGWLVGRVLERRGPGPWWTHLASAPEFERALSVARSLATGDARIWYHAGGEEYLHIGSDCLAG
jgi:hypothetical protein